jgi:hypothetical protein
MLSTDSGEVFVVWSDDRHGYGNRDIYAEKIGALTPSESRRLPREERSRSARCAPNPARDFLRVELALPQGATANLALVDLRGRVVRTRTGGASTTFETNGLTPGIYWLRATYAGGSASARVAIVH